MLNHRVHLESLCYAVGLEFRIPLYFDVLKATQLPSLEFLTVANILSKILTFLVSPFVGTERRLRKMGLSAPAVMQQDVKCCQLQQMCLTPAKPQLASWPGTLCLQSRQEYSLVTFFVFRQSYVFWEMFSK